MFTFARNAVLDSLSDLRTLYVYDSPGSADAHRSPCVVCLLIILIPSSLLSSSSTQLTQHRQLHARPSSTLRRPVMDAGVLPNRERISWSSTTECSIIQRALRVAHSTHLTYRLVDVWLSVNDSHHRGDLVRRNLERDVASTVAGSVVREFMIARRRPVYRR